MANAGLLVGLTDVRQGRGLEVKPYVAGTVANAPGRTPEITTATTADIGGEITYNLTPSLRAVGTINTDFAETEVDTRRVNLTRCPLFFPEKSGFFLDGATFFDFPNNGFLSRRIGLTSGQPQRINGGAKLTGQAGGQDVGLLYVRTGEEGTSRVGASVCRTDADPARSRRGANSRLSSRRSTEVTSQLQQHSRSERVHHSTTTPSSAIARLPR